MITGSIVAIVTPLTDSGELDLQTMTKIVEWHLDQGTDAIVAVGTTGESATLNVAEHCKLVEHVVSVVSGSIPVIAGTGANSTTEAIEWSEAANKAGADACLLVTPYYNKPNQNGLYQHFKLLAETVDIPQILYNVPGRTACDMLPETIYRLSLLDNIVGVKEATGDLQRGKEVIELCSDDFAVYSGDDSIALDFILAGAKGNISVTANVAPKIMHEMCKQALAGQADAARTLNNKVASLHKNLFLESNPMPVKWAMQEMGLIGPGIRLPLIEFDESYHDLMRQSLREASAL